VIALSTTAKQALVMAGAGVALVSLVVLIARKQLITVRYALGWISIGLLVISVSGLQRQLRDVIEREALNNASQPKDGG
jgi:FtsH-binding integral membrane protein